MLDFLFKTVKKNVFLLPGEFILRFLILNLLISAFMPSVVEARQKKYNIFVLQSYHEGFAWTNDSINIFRSVFAGSPERIEIYTEYLDSKRFSSEEMFSAYHDLFKAKYFKTRFDLVILLDDYAISFINKYKSVLFPNTPFLICDIGNIHEPFKDNRRGWTGIFVNLDIKSTLELIFTMHPSVEHIYAVSDNTPIGVYTADELAEAGEFFKDKFQLHELRDLSSDMLVRYLRNLPVNSVILLLSFFNDSTGKRFSPQDTFQLISTSCNVPVYTVLEEYVYHGAVGGVVFNYDKYYQKVADTALEVLRGKPVDTIPVVKVMANKFFFNYNKLKQLNIPQHKIPSGSVVINKPVWFADKEISIVTLSIIGVVFLFCLIILSANSVKVKRAKKELFVFKKFAQGSGQGLAMVDFNYNITYLNPALCKMLGIDKPESYIGKSFLDFYPSEIKKKFQNQVMPLMLEKSVWTGELSVKSLSGTLIPTLESCFVIYNDNNIPLCFGSVVSDTTKIKKTERELRLFKSISDSANYGSVITDIEGRIIYVNNYMANTHGYSAEDIKGGNLSLFFCEKELGLAEDLFNEIFREGNFSGKEICHVRKNGEEFPMLMNGLLIEDTDGSNPLVAITAIDITEHKKLLAALMKNQKLESISLLAGGVAHDFNNLLFSILGNISLVMNKIKDKGILSKLAQAETASEQARYLSQQLLVFSKGGMPVKQTTDLAYIIRETVNFTLKGSNIKPVFELSKSLYPVEADNTQISQVIHNIILNSYQAMPGGGLIDIKCENIELNDKNKQVPLPNGKYVFILIKDRGAGIPEENLHQVFDPYFTTKNKNVGLGLTICYSIIKKHDGYIDIESKPGYGTEVYIYLPASDKTAAQKSVPIQKKPKKNFNILIMEEDELVKSILGEFFKSIGYKYQFAKNGDDAVSMYKKSLNSHSRFDAVFMDLTIAGSKSAVETLNELKQIDKNVKTILSSGYTNDAVVVRHKEKGFTSFLSKPFSINELRGVLKEIL